MSDPDPRVRRLLSEARKDWRYPAALSLALLLGVVFTALLVLSTTLVRQERESARLRDQVDMLTFASGCRADLAARVDLARGERDLAAARLDARIADGLLAIARDDEAALAARVPLIEEGVASLDRASARLEAALAERARTAELCPSNNGGTP